MLRRSQDQLYTTNICGWRKRPLAVITGLWRTPIGDRFSFHGRHFHLEDSPALPKPSQPGGPPIIIGGAGKKRTPAISARYGNEFNHGVEGAAAQFERVRRACRAIERDPAELR